MSALAKNNPVVVVDNGTGFSKLGYAGNNKPDYLVPTCICVNTRKRPEFKGMYDLDFVIGEDAIEAISNPAYNVAYPMKHGKISDWNAMERFWEQAFFKYLRCEPEDHFVMLTEPPLNPPENREAVAEIMFETFNVSGLYIAVQAVLALAASWTSKESERLGLAGTVTGTVIDSGDGVTHVIPMVEGYVIGSAIKHIPLAGRDITKFIQTFIKERERAIPSEQAQLAAQKIKEEHCYICKDIVKEFSKFDAAPEKFVRQYGGVSRGRKWSIDVGYERFLGPELFFNPEIFSAEYTTPLHETLDSVIQSCPIDCRRDLYRNIVLSGGSTMFKNFDKRLERDIEKVAERRTNENLKRLGLKTGSSKKLEINVITPPISRYSVWFGGSMLAANRGFLNVCKTREQYREFGPSCCRHSAVFTSLT